MTMNNDDRKNEGYPPSSRRITMTKNFHLRLATLLLIAQFAVRAFAQSAPQLIPPQLEKELSAHASDVAK